MMPVVTLLGDSISAGYGLTEREALPARLERAMSELGVEVRVVGAGVDGDTTEDGLARLERSVPTDTDLCVVALGANDLMQAWAPARIRAALHEIVDRLKRRGTAVLLCGMRAPPWLSSYAPTFDAVFPGVAVQQGVALYPFLLDGVALDPAFNQRDRIHPNAAGIDRIAQRLAPAVIAALPPRLEPEGTGD